MSSAYYAGKLYDQTTALPLLENASELTLKAKAYYHFEALVTRGTSGVGFGYALSLCTGIPLVIVRKPNESSHGEPIFPNTYWGFYRFAFIDDFICSGATFREVRRTLLKERKNVVCSLLYSDNTCRLPGQRARRTHSLECRGCQSPECLHNFPLTNPQ